MYSLVLLCRRANYDFHGACLHGSGGPSVTEHFSVRGHIIFLTFIINIIFINFFSFINMRLFGTTSRATLSSAILTVRASKISDVSIADNRQVPWEVELSSTSQGMLLIPGMGNGERGTGNGERGTGNGSLGTSVQRQSS